MSRRIALATACGNKKRPGTWPAYQLYQSPRIKALHRRRGEFPLFILSAEYGLIECHTSVASYQRLMTPERAVELRPAVAEVMKQFDGWAYFKAGARSEYAECIKSAGTEAGVPVALVGFANMGGLHDCIQIARVLGKGMPLPPGIRSLELCGFDANEFQQK